MSWLRGMQPGGYADADVEAGREHAALDIEWPVGQKEGEIS